MSDRLENGSVHKNVPPTPKVTVDDTKLNIELPEFNRLEIRPTEKGKYNIFDIKTGVKLSFVLQWQEEALEMKRLLAKAIIQRNDCREVFLNSCKLYPANLRYTNNPKDADIQQDFNISTDSLLPIHWDPIILHNEDIESALQGKNKKNPLPDGTLPFAQQMVNFLEAIHQKEFPVKK